MPQLPLYTTVFQALGASVTFMPFSQVYDGLRTRVITGVEADPETFLDYELYEVCKYCLRTNHSVTIYSFMIQDQILEKMTEEQQEVICNAAEGVMDIGGAKPGDKCLLDAIVPARDAYCAALEAGKDFSAALDDMKDAAKKGWQSTEGMVAKIGRASRLGERSRGVLDAGATSSYLMLTSLADSIKGLLK